MAPSNIIKYCLATGLLFSLLFLGSHGRVSAESLLGMSVHAAENETFFDALESAKKLGVRVVQLPIAWDDIET